MFSFLLGIKQYNKITPMIVLLIEKSKYLSPFFSRKSFGMKIHDREKRKIPYVKARLQQKINEIDPTVEKTPIYWLTKHLEN